MTLANASLTKDPLFEPLKIRNLTLKNRIMSTSHASGMDDQEMPAERYQRYHEEKAKGGLALTMFGGSSNVSADSPSMFDQLRVDSDRVIPYFQGFSERIHQHGAALMCQITHLGRRGNSFAGNWLPTLAPSMVRETLHRSFPREMDEADIKRVIKDYGQAARRCYEGGLDGIETLAGGHLIGQFFSTDTNLRTDQYGGSIQNRARFALMVHAEMRKQVGDDFIIGMRLSIDDFGVGLEFEHALEIARILKEHGAIDFFNCIAGRMDTELALAEHNMPEMTQPSAPFLEKVGLFKKEIGMPVFHAAKIADVATARYAIKNNLLDMVGMTRAHIADPQIVNKILNNQENRIRPCIGACHCMYIKPHCIHNATTGRETVLPQTIIQSENFGKKVIVVGGGPAGLETARVAAERGHNVILFEAATQLGGQVVTAAKASSRRNLISIINWLENELQHLNVDVRLNSYVDAEEVMAHAPDFVFIATGGIPLMPAIEGARHFQTVWEVLNLEVQAKKNVLICDQTGRQAAASCALDIAEKGIEVTLATIDDRMVAEIGYAERAVCRKQLHELNVEMIVDVRLTAVRESEKMLIAELTNELTGQSFEREFDQIVIENGTTPIDEVFHELRDLSANHGVTDLNMLLTGNQGDNQTQLQSDGFILHRIGDAISSRSIHSAILDAYRIAVRI